MRRNIFLSADARIAALMIVGLSAAASEAPLAEEIYKCTGPSGKPAFVANPQGYVECRPVDLQVDHPNPADVTRALDEKQRKEEEARIAEEKAQQERLIRAREIEAEAARRRARAAEEELRLLKQRQAPEPYPRNYVPIWPVPVPVPVHPHPHPKHPPPDPNPDAGRGDPPMRPFGRIR